MADNGPPNLSIYHIMDGLREGLSLFSGTSRVALLQAQGPEDPISVCDPQNLLDGHEPKLAEIYLEDSQWREDAVKLQGLRLFDEVVPENNLQLAGLISFGGRSRAVFYQMWFTEQHPDMAHIGPTERWLEHATWLLSHDVATENAFYSGTSGYILREYATHAIRDYLTDELNITLGMDVHLRVYPILDAVLAISKTVEEGAWPLGRLVFMEPAAARRCKDLVLFPAMERPELTKFKHVRKLLLSVENSSRALVSDGRSVLGIALDQTPEALITADFCGGHGFLRVKNKLVCSFYDGRFHSSTRKANLVQLEEILIEAPIDPSAGHLLYQIISRLVHSAEEGKHGCTLVIDLNSKPLSISGQRMETPLDLSREKNLKLTQSLGKLDGALHIRPNLTLCGFGCILDGHSVMGEDRARGARFNSALRFTAENKNVVVVVVSSDRPVSIIQDGLELTAHCDWKPLTGFLPPPFPLSQWIKR